MSARDHRLYSYMSEPIRVVGLTIDELGLVIGDLLAFILFDALWLKLTIILLCPLSVYGIKKGKTLAAGFSLVSFLHWHLGIRFGLPTPVVPSWKRSLLG